MGGWGVGRGSWTCVCWDVGRGEVHVYVEWVGAGRCMYMWVCREGEGCGDGGRGKGGRR